MPVSGIIPSLIPRPIRDIVTYPFEPFPEIETRWQKIGHNRVQGKVTDLSVERLELACKRTFIAGVVGLAIFTTGYPLTAATIGIIVSFPSVCIVGGSWLLYHGATATIAAISTGCFQNLGISLTLLLSGYIVLERHDRIPSGAFEVGPIWVDNRRHLLHR